MDLRAGKADAAMQHAQLLIQMYPDAAEGHAVEGEVWMARKDLKQAIKSFEAAYARAATGLLAMRLRDAWRLAGESQKGRSILEDHVGKHPEDIGTKTALATAYQAEGDKPGAIKLYAEIVEAAPDNVIALNNLAWLYFEAGDDRALDLAKRAQERAPDSVEVLDTLGWILVQKGQVNSGIEYLARAATLAPDVPQVQYHLGAALVQSGDREQARAALQRATDSKADFEEREAARKLLDSLR